MSTVSTSETMEGWRPWWAMHGLVIEIRASFTVTHLTV